METWGELFWDAWIRLRLASRRLYRTYWPPQFKAWQVCTATGIVSILLTLIVLNWSGEKSTLQAENGKSPAARKHTKTLAGAHRTKPVVPEVDEFTDPELTASVDAGGDDPLGAPAQPDDLPGDPTVGLNQRRTQVVDRGDLVAAAPEEEFVTETDIVSGAVPVMDPVEDQSGPESKKFPEQPSLEPEVAMTQEVPPASDVEQPLLETSPPQAPAASTLEPIIRNPGHYDRFGDEPQIETPASSVRETRLKDLPHPVRHTPFVTPIRSNSNYAHLGEREDAEENRHSVRDIRPTRTDNVAFPGAKVGDIAQPPAEQPAAPTETEQTDNSVPENPVDVPVSEPSVTETQLPVQPAEQPDETIFDAPPATPEVPPVATPPAQDQFDSLSTQAVPEVAEPEDAGLAPPVLFSPDPEPSEAEAVEPMSPQATEDHGPVHSTNASDHEAHQEADAFTRPPRRPKADWPAPAGPPETEQPAPMDEPNLSEQPAEEPAPPATTPRVQPRAAPPIIIQSNDESHPAIENPHLEEDRVIPPPPAGETRQRGPERITIPKRMPAVEPAEEPAPQESEFTATRRPINRSAPQVTMEITGPRKIPVGTQVVLHFKLQNTGTEPVTGIVVTDVLPPGLQHRVSPDLEYNVARLEPGESRETNLTVQCVALGTIVNKAVLRADGDVSTQAEIQFEVTNTKARPNTPVPPPPAESQLTMHHHGPERWLVDSTGQFLVTVTNTSNQTVRNVSISQTYPEGTDLVHATVGNQVDERNRTVTWSIPEFAPGVSYILETELHSLTSGPATSVARIKIGDSEIAQDKWTAVSYRSIAARPRP